MLLRELVLLVLVLVVAASKGGAACGDRMFKCDNEQCIVAKYKCNGKTECSDGSDEVAAVCDKIPTEWMGLGDVVTARLQFKEDYGGVWIHFCDARGCSSLIVWGRSPDGALAYNAYTGCNKRGAYYTTKDKIRPKGEWKVFSDALLVFKMERRADQLVVWLSDHENKTMTVNATEGSNLLRLRAFYLTSDVDVDFSSPTAVRELTAYGWNQTTLFLRWQPPKSDSRRVKSYVVSVDGHAELQVSPDSWCAAWPGMICYLADRPRYRVRSTNHSVTVAATNAKGQRGSAAPIAVNTTSIDPEVVRGVQLLTSVDAVTVMWQLPNGLNGELYGFSVVVAHAPLYNEEVLPSKRELYPAYRLPQQADYSLTVTRLQSNTYYTATVRCESSGGVSDVTASFKTTPEP